jgi:hypothetical protein
MPGARRTFPNRRLSSTSLHTANVVEDQLSAVLSVVATEVEIPLY